MKNKTTINVGEFKDFIKRSTWNYMIPSCWVKLQDGRVSSKMLSPDKTAILFLDKENNIIPDLNDVDLYFKDPDKNLKPYLNLFEDEAEVKINDTKMTLYNGDQITNIFFSDSNFINTFSGNEPNLEIFYNVNMSNLVENFKKIKKIASKFDKIYFSVENGKMMMETTDKTNPHANSLRFSIDDVEKKDISMHFNFKVVSSLFSIVEPERFEIGFVYIEEQEAGMIIVKSKDGTEKYYIPSSQEN